MAVSEDSYNPDVEALMKEGKEALENDDLEKADKLLHQALELDPNNSDLQVELGNLFYNFKKTVLSREHYQKASELKADSPRPWHGLGRIEESLGNTRNAIKYFEKAIDLDSDFYVSWNSLGNCYLDLGEWEKAEESYHKAISLRPKEFMAIYGLALFYSKIGQLNQAINILEPFLDSEKQYRKELLTTLSQMKLRAKCLDETLTLTCHLKAEFSDENT